MSTFFRGGSLIWAQLLAWLVLLSIAIHTFCQLFSVPQALVGASLEILWLIVIVYINTLLLTKRFLFNGSFMMYITVLVVVCLVLTPTSMGVHFAISQFFDEKWPRFMTNQVLIFIELFVAASISTIIQIPIEWIKVQREKKDLVTKNFQSELEFLKTQINPHFLFNTLNNLYALTLKKSDDAPEVVLKLSDMMRYMLYECNEKIVPLEKEIRYIHNYIALEKIRHPKDRRIHFSIRGTPDNKYVAPLLFITFVENSFKHGMNKTIGDSFIDIKLFIEDNALEFIVENSKPETMPGFQQNRKDGGIGLANAKKRLEFQYPNKHNLFIEDTFNTYKITLKLNLN